MGGGGSTMGLIDPIGSGLGLYGGGTSLKAVLDPWNIKGALTPNIPAAVPAPPPAPNVSNSQGDMDAASLAAAQATQRGRSATMLTGGTGVSDPGSTSHILLGQ